MSLPPTQPQHTQTATPTPISPDEQRQTWRNDLRYKRYNVIISFVGFALVSIGLFLNYHQSNIVAKNLRNSVQQSMVKLTTDLDRIYIDHPELRRFIYAGGKSDHWTAMNDEQAAATAVFAFDVFDIASSQVANFRDQWATPEAWTNWITDEFAKSEFFQKQFLTNQSWYGPDMYSLYKQGLEKASQKH